MQEASLKTPVNAPSGQDGTAVATKAVKGNSLGSDAWKRFKKNKMGMFGLWVMIVYVVVIYGYPLIPGAYSFEGQVIEHANLPPALFNGLKNGGQLWLEREMNNAQVDAKNAGRSELDAKQKQRLEDVKKQIASERKVLENRMQNPHERVYIFGTDDLGRDMLARTIYGGQLSIAIGLFGAIICITIGLVLGSLAGFLGGRVDAVIMRVVDVLYGLPYMLIVIIIMAVSQGGPIQNIINLFIGLSVVSWLTEARVVRGQIIGLKNREFVEAARSMGAGTWRIIMRHLVPNTVGVLIVFMTLRVPTFIMEESFLSFLGLGVSAPYASWGKLVKDGVQGMEIYPWRLFLPALVMTLFLFAMNFLGDGLRDAFDPHSKNKK